MTQAALITLILSLCESKNPNISFEQKQDCLEFYVNCSIQNDGSIDIGKCKKYDYNKGDKNGKN